MLEWLNQAQKLLKEASIDGWLLYDFKGSNKIAHELLKIPKECMLTRRFFYWIPALGIPVRFVPSVEQHYLDDLPGEKRVFSSWKQLEADLKGALDKSSKVIMEYSPKAALPSLSSVDAGTIELIQSFGVQVLSSADILGNILSSWSFEQLSHHRYAAQVVQESVSAAWEKVTQSLDQGKKISEWDVQEFIKERFKIAGCVTSSGPICAVNAHSADPHYVAEKESASFIKQGEFVLIDLWCKRDLPEATYADICRVAVVGREASEKEKEVFSLVFLAQKEALKLIEERSSNKKRLEGWEVDATARTIIEEGGYGEYFIHRLGHNIGQEDHGHGTHLDNYESKDERALLPKTCFSVEPGIYLPGLFGVRLETDIYLHDDGQMEVTGGMQKALISLGLEP